jgi:uncharacterized OsmC-like protein
VPPVQREREKMYGLEYEVSTGRGAQAETVSVYYSYHFELDHHRAEQIRRCAQAVAPIDDVSLSEEFPEQDDKKLKRLIDASIEKCTVLVVLIGERTSERYYVSYEIAKGLELGKIVLGVFVHELEDRQRRTAARGRVPWLLQENGVQCTVWDARGFWRLVSRAMGGSWRVS